MKYLVFDTETTTKLKGNPFVKSNKLCLVGIKDEHGYTEYDIEYGGRPYGDSLRDIRARFAAADLVVAFNAKFDLHWLRRYINDLPVKRVWDCQLCVFLESDQTIVLPSLDKACVAVGLDGKYDVVKTEYWDNGIDTLDIPHSILGPYLEQDVRQTEALFQWQYDYMDQRYRKLFNLQCADLLVLLEMESNGLKYETAIAEQRGTETASKIAEIDVELRRLANHDCVNFNSDDHVSSLLYGGTIWEKYREAYERTLKDGTVKQRERWSVRPVEFKQLVRPLKRTETLPTSKISDDELPAYNRDRVSQGLTPFVRHFSVAEPVLRRLAARGRGKRIIAFLLERSKLDKLNSTYYEGLLTKMKEFEWDDGYIHGQFNQCIAITGRLSSSSPNLQNFSGDIKELFTSRLV